MLAKEKIENSIAFLSQGIHSKDVSFYVLFIYLFYVMAVVNVMVVIDKILFYPNLCWFFFIIFPGKYIHCLKFSKKLISIISVLFTSWKFSLSVFLPISASLCINFFYFFSFTFFSLFPLFPPLEAVSLWTFSNSLGFISNVVKFTIEKYLLSISWWICRRRNYEFLQFWLSIKSGFLVLNCRGGDHPQNDFWKNNSFIFRYIHSGDLF